MKKEDYVLTIKAEARPGLLHLLTGVIEKKLIKIKSLTSSPTDIHDIILVTIEVNGDESELSQLAFKIENIIEVFKVEVLKYNVTTCLRAAYFKLNKEVLESSKVVTFSKYDAVIVKLYPDAFLLAKYGTDTTIRQLYNELDGPHLLGFSQTGLITESALIGHDDIERISKLAA